jgi:hypothetical protein
MEEQASELMVDQLNPIDALYPGPSEDTSGVMIPVDPEPSGLRMALVGIFLLATIVAYVLSTRFATTGVCNPLGLFIALGAGGAVMYLAEKWLKPRWKTSRFVHLTATSLRVLSKGKPSRVIDPTMQVNVLMWHFQIKRRTRVPKGWYVVALALEQDEDYLPVYTLLSPESFADLSGSDQFTKLSSRKELSQLQDNSNLRKAGFQRRLHTAEFARGVEGAEMVPEDFETYLNWLQTHCSNWMPDISSS